MICADRSADMNTLAPDATDRSISEAIAVRQLRFEKILMGIEVLVPRNELLGVRDNEQLDNERGWSATNSNSADALPWHPDPTFDN